MFEKEAEEYEEKAECVEVDDYGHKVYSSSDIEQAYQKGAEFGYNKANEWIPFKKELPPLNKYVLIWNNVDIFPISGKRIQLPDNDWAMNFPNCRVYRSIAIDYAWKEIVLPKED